MDVIAPANFNWISYLAVVPIALWGVLKWYGSESANLLECLALYGYANVIWVPVSIASVSPIQSISYLFPNTKAITTRKF